MLKNFWLWLTENQPEAGLSYQCPKCGTALTGQEAEPVYCGSCHTTYETFYTETDIMQGSYTYGLTGRSVWGRYDINPFH